MQKKISFNGVSIELPMEQPIFTHSVTAMIATFGSVEGNHNIPYFEKLMQYKKSDIPELELLHDICALNSIRLMNYQINNGGFEQYYDNGYHEYRAGDEDGALAQLDINAQIEFLEKFILFILLADDNKKYFDDLTKTVVMFRNMQSNILDYESLDADDKEYADINGADAFDTQWYKVSEVIEWGIELYAQYLIKRLEEMKIEPSNKQSRIL